MGYYVAHYTMDAYYEPAEGGYYVATTHLTGFLHTKRMKTARKWLKENAKALGYLPAAISHRYAEKHKGSKRQRTNKYADDDYLNSKYIGEGAYLVIERGYGARRRGYQPYE